MLQNSKIELENKPQRLISPRYESYLMNKDGNLKMTWSENKGCLKLNKKADHIFVFDPRPVKMLSDYNSLTNKHNFFKSLNLEAFAEVLTLVNDTKFKCISIIENIEEFIFDAGLSFEEIKTNSKNTDFLYKSNLYGSTKLQNQDDLFKEVYKIMGKTHPHNLDQLQRHLEENIPSSIERKKSNDLNLYEKNLKSINTFSISNLKKS